jgi:hypothetical protein
MTMYEVVKLKNAFEGNSKKEIKSKLMVGSYPQLEDSEKRYDKEFITVINLMLNVCVDAHFIFFFFFFCVCVAL